MTGEYLETTEDEFRTVIREDGTVGIIPSMASIEATLHETGIEYPEPAEPKSHKFQIDEIVLPYAEYLKLLADAELGAMVRQMPRKSQLMHRDPEPDNVSSAERKEWEVHIITMRYRFLYDGGTPDVALKAAHDALKAGKS